MAASILTASEFRVIWERSACNGTVWDCTVTVVVAVAMRPRGSVTVSVTVQLPGAEYVCGALMPRRGPYEHLGGVAE